jgi:2-phosphoxylose phosphatase
MVIHSRVTPRVHVCPRLMPPPCSRLGISNMSACTSLPSTIAIHRRMDRICSYIWHAAQNASNYTSLTFGKNILAPRRLPTYLIIPSELPGAFFSELADALEEPTHRLALYVGHDSTLVRLLAGLGAVPLRWPSFGSEVVFEVHGRTHYPWPLA